MSKLLSIRNHIPSALQRSFEFPTTAISFTIEHPYERHALRVMFALLAVLLCAYLYFVSASILNVIARKEAQTRISLAENGISALEQQYFSVSQVLTPDRGIALGLSPISSISYVHRAGTAALADANLRSR